MAHSSKRVGQGARVLILGIALGLSGAAAASAQTVQNIAARGACSTAGVEGISRQLADAQMCIRPGAFVRFAPHPGITLTSSRVHPYAQATTRDALHRAAGRIGLSVNSAFRTLADQYVLYHSGGCGLAARPGRSNHQSGRAVDLGNYSAARSVMQAQGCTWLGSSDPVHFDCPGTDRRSDSIRAFQVLWNVNNPGDRIAEDGVYGPQTESRLGRSPAGGFARGACAATEPDPPPATGAAGVARGVVFEDRGSGFADTTVRLSGATLLVTETGASVTTDGSGGWSVDLPAGTYNLTASKAGYAAASRTCTVAGGGEVWCSLGLVAEVAAGVLEGVVFEGADPDRRVIGAEVRVAETGASTTSREGDGAWRFDLAAGSYTVEVSGEGLVPATRLCEVASGETTWCSVSVTLEGGGGGSSTVVVEDHDPTAMDHADDRLEDPQDAIDGVPGTPGIKGGCSASGTPAAPLWPAWTLLALLALRRRR